MKKQEIQIIINAIKVYQANPFFHPLTCENDSSHRNLEPFEDNGVVKLKCLDCDFIQDNIPYIVIGAAEIELPEGYLGLKIPKKDA